MKMVFRLLDAYQLRRIWVVKQRQVGQHQGMLLVLCLSVISKDCARGLLDELLCV